MADNRNKIELNIKSSINTDTIIEDFKDFGDTTAPLLQNTGIERDGGITNIYRTQNNYTEVGQYVVTEDGKVISIVDSTTPNYKVVKIDGKAIGQVSAYGVEKTIEVAGVNDIFLTASSYTTCSLVDNSIVVREYDFSSTLLNSKTITFTNLGTVLIFFTSLSFVRWDGMAYSDSLEWSLRLGDQVIILQESNPGITVAKALQTTSVLGTSSINASVVYGSQVVFAGNNGRIGSFDGNNWKNWDGTGSGIGIYNNGDATLGVIGSNNILSMVIYTYGGTNYLVVGGVGGRIGSYNGTAWNKWDSGVAVSNNATVISTDNVTAMTTFEGNLIVAGSVGKLGSWSGTAWTNYNVAGLSDNATIIGAVSINSLLVYGGKLIIAGASGRLGNISSTNVKKLYTQASAVDSPSNNGTVIGTNAINALAEYDNALIVAGVGGRLGSFGNTIYKTITEIQTYTNSCISVINSQICLLGAGYQITDIDNTGLFPTPVNPTYYSISEIQTIINGLITKCNAQLVAIGAGYPIFSIDNTGLFPTPVNPTYYSISEIQTIINGLFLKLSTRLANISAGKPLSIITNPGFSSYNWYNYNVPFAGVIADDGTNMGSSDIKAMTVFDNILVTAGASGRIASMSDTTKYQYDSGTGISNNGTIIGANSINTLTEYQSSLIVSGATSVVNSMSTSGGFTPFYNAGGTPVSNLLTGFNSLGYLYTYRYENGIYLINLVGNSLCKSYTLNNSTKDITIINAKYCLPQVQSGKTRHITTTDNSGYTPIYDASSIKATGLVGYTDFTTYSGTIVYPAAPYILSNITKSQAGWGASDFTFKLTSSTTNIYNYVPQYQASTSGLYQVVQSNTDTLINAYGKLTNNVGITPTKPFEFRVGWTNGVQSYFSAALLDGFATDALGVVITNIGEIDDFYQPMIRGDDTILYTFNNKFIIKKIGNSIPEYIQHIDEGIWKVNTLSPLNIVDANAEVLELGSLDFNNRMLFTSAAAPGNTVKIASVIEGKYSNSIDTGEKLITINPVSSANVEIIGYRIPVVSTSVRDYAVSTYFDSTYSFSTLNDGSELIISNKVDTLYVANTNIPISQGLVYNSGTVAAGGRTIFLKPNYDGYSIGNDIEGVYNSFTLFGQLYLYDQKSIYAADVDQVTGIFNTKTLLTSSPGLKYIATAPTQAYFLSEFDNSLYIFNGGRTLDKFKRMNQLEVINSGIFNTRDNTLVLDTDNTFIWVRDNIITQNNKLASQTNLKYYDTRDGIIIGNNSSNWRYTYENGPEVVPLSIQTPYYGFNTDEKSILSEYTITIYNENKDKVELNGVVYSITENDAKEQLVNWVINPKDYYNGGYARVRVQPQVQRSLGTSLKLSTDSKIILVSVIAQFTKGENAPVANARSR